MMSDDLPQGRILNDDLAVTLQGTKQTLINGPKVSNEVAQDSAKDTKNGSATISSSNSVDIKLSDDTELEGVIVNTVVLC
ncbi:hypothetical protein PR048_014250 [Dryococelus australis]|uniref:Uncharacterized protein n=1 Tax=Dryococelus australis TaxID=614101 RepID=A0ABQ9HDW9_9NEOP|nr:hypothetical protein PR048_014250 [Dryococelus australis]